MGQTLLIALGAGAASALLVATVSSGSALAVPLFYLAPLPVLIVGLGWSHLSALIAASAAAVGIGVLFGMELLVAYVAGVGLPAYILAYLALMARQNGDGTFEWFPVGRLVLAAAILGSLAVAALIPLVASNVESYQAALQTLIEAMLTERAGDTLPPDSARLVAMLVAILPPAAAVLTMSTQLGNLYLAARIARTSGRLMRPWPDLSALSFPKATAALAGGVFVAASLVGGFIGLLAETLAATLSMAFALAGLAVIHSITRGAAGRALVIGTVWLAALALGWPFLALAVLGLADLFLALRARWGRRGPPAGGPPAANDL